MQQIDPYYMPVQVDSCLRKCESAKSIIEHLQNNGAPLAFSATELTHESEDFPPKVAIFNEYSHSYVLQLPPLKTHSNPTDTTNSDYKPSTIYTPTFQVQESIVPINYFKVHDDSSVSHLHTRRHVACLNLLFDEKQHDDSQNTNCSHCISSDEANEKDSEYDLDSLILDKLGDSETDNSSQNDCIMLTFPPTQCHNCNENLTTVNVEPKDDESDDKEQLIQKHITMEGHLAESNLTINPHHFDPL